MTKVLYPGSFDPITKGHMDIIEQASKLFDEVLVAVMQNPNKPVGFFTIEERIAIIKKIYENINNIHVVTASGATIDVALLYGCKAIIRGIRGVRDYDEEEAMQQINKDLSNNQVNTVCFFSNKDYRHVSSSMVRECFKLNKDISSYVDPLVKEKMLIKKR